MKLPPQAKKVFTGNIFDVYQWQQEMYDGSYETFEMLSRSATVEVIAVQGDKIILSQQEQPAKPVYYSLFGGRCEKDEDYESAAKRELLEESGLSSPDWDHFKTIQPMHKIDWDIAIYIARHCTKIADQKLDAGEKIKIVPCTFEEFIDIVVDQKFSGSELALEILRMKHLNTLDAFHARLFS